MKNKHKIILVKFVISLSGLLMIFSLFLGITSEMKLYGDRSEYYNNIAYVLMLLFSISTIIMIILMMKIDIRPEKTKSKKHKIKIEDYKGFKDYLENKLMNNGYNEEKKYDNNLFEINYFIKYQFKCSTIIALIKLEELTEEIFDKYKENYFEDFGDYLLQNSELNAADNFNLIYIICVDRVNQVFSKYTEGNVKQYFKRYILPVGVSFGSKTLYIATQKDGYAISKCKSLTKLFKSYIEDIIETENQ